MYRPSLSLSFPPPWSESQKPSIQSLSSFSLPLPFERRGTHTGIYFPPSSIPLASDHFMRIMIAA